MIGRFVWRWTLTLGVVAVALGAYVASPFLAAWQLREAIKSGDTRMLERKVEWEPVRASLKASLARHADLLPAATAAAEAVKPTMWQRVKSAFGSSMLDRFVESYVTPEGLPQLFSYRQSYRQYVKGEDLAAEKAKPWHERMGRFMARVKRAEFQGATRLVLEMEDRNTADRRYRSVFELMDWEWKLTSLEIIGPIRDLTQNLSEPAMEMRPRLADYGRALWSAARDAARLR